MKLQAFLFKLVKVRGPMGVYEEERAFPTGSGAVSHEGKAYAADEHGWADVPDAVGAALKRLAFRHPHGGTIRYCTQDEVDENLRLGLVEQKAVQPPVEPKRTARKSSS